MNPFNPLLSPLIHLQGDIKMGLMEYLPQGVAHVLAADLLDMVAKSQVCRPEVAKAYAELSVTTQP